MEAQRYPNDFDGIVAGAPVNFYQAMASAGVWHLQRMFMNDYAGNLAVDTNADGSVDSLNPFAVPASIIDVVSAIENAFL